MSLAAEPLWRRPALLSQGFRPFFLAAGIWAAAALTVWIVMLETGTALPSRFDPLSWHIHEMLFGFVLAAIAGFMLTAIPNWTGRPPIAGIPLAGGHSIDSVEPIYGLVAIGIVHPGKLKKNSGAQAGDVVILSKGLGIGVLAAALKKDALSAEGYAQMIATATQLNTVGCELSGLKGVHALTDVTGFGLLGHLLEMCRGSGLRAELKFDQVPILSEALPLAQQGYGPGAIERNLASYGHEVGFAAHLQPWQHRLLADAQTSGGLLVAVAHDDVDAVLSAFKHAGFEQAAVIGTLQNGAPHVAVN